MCHRQLNAITGRLLLASVIAIAATPASALDCTAPATKVEQQICQTPRLRALDAELGAAMAAARAEPAVEQAFLDDDSWRDTRDNCETYEYGCIEWAYLVRLASVRSHAALRGRFAQASPDGLVGDFAEKGAKCQSTGTGLECKGVVDRMTVKRGPGQRLTATAMLFFDGGNSCFFEGEGEWVVGTASPAGEARISAETEPGEPCVLVARLSGDTLSLFDPYGRCTRWNCGIRGNLDKVRLYKVKVQ